MWRHAGLSDFKRVTPLCLAIYVLVLPLIFWSSASYKPRSVPSGKVVEHIFPVKDRDPPWYFADAYRLASRREGDDIVVYENLTPLPPDHFAVLPPNQGHGRRIKFRALDDTNPRTNGRDYWAVIPGKAADR